MQVLGILLFASLPAVLLSAKCTNAPTTADPDVVTTSEPSTQPPPVDTTTPDYPAPESWPKGKFALMMAGPECTDFWAWKKGYFYQDTEDYYNGNDWPKTSPGLMGPMKYDGFTFHFCTKHKWTGDYHWPAGDYCINQVSNKCPPGFDVGEITWDDEDDNNQNTRRGKVPQGVYGNEFTTQYYCCRNDSSASFAIDLPVTKPFYMWRYTDDCQKVRRMTVTEEVIQWDDNDTPNVNSQSGFHPMNTGNQYNHKLHLCLYQPNV